MSTGAKGAVFSSRRAAFALAHPDLTGGNRRTPSFPDYALTTTKTEGVVGKAGGAAKTWVTDRYGLRVERGRGSIASLHVLAVLFGFFKVQPEPW